MQRTPTSKEAVSGQSYIEGRYDQAVISGNPDGQNSPVHAKGGIGVVIAVVVIAISFLLAKMSPSPDHGQSDLMITQAGGLYVAYEKDGQRRLHPALNLASARLIAGKADKPSVVKPDTLTDYPRGLPMGIIGAPNSLEHHNGSEEDAGWGVCVLHDDKANLSLTRADSLRTTVVAGSDSWEGGTKLDKGRAVLVKPESDLTRRYLVFDHYVAEIGAEDFPVQTALGISAEDMDAAVVVSDAFINSLTPKPRISTPAIAGKGEPSKIAHGAAVGDVLTTLGVDGTRRFHVLLENGVQAIPVSLAEILSATGSPMHTIANSEDVTRQKQVGTLDTTAYPVNIPTLDTPAAMCSVWSKPLGASNPVKYVLTDQKLPVNPDVARTVVPQEKSSTGKKLADGFVTAPGKGWFVRVTGDSDKSQAEAQVAFIDDTGIRYDVVADGEGSFTPAVKALGLTGEPVLIPDSVASILVKGADLDREAAMVQHAAGAEKSVPETSTAPPSQPPVEEPQVEQPEEPAVEEPAEEKPVEQPAEQP